jgi:hypothetical protein
MSSTTPQDPYGQSREEPAHDRRQESSTEAGRPSGEVQVELVSAAPAPVSRPIVDTRPGGWYRGLDRKPGPRR